MARVYGKALEVNGLRHGLPSLIASDVRIVDAETGTRRQIDYVFDVGGVRVHSNLTTLTQKTLDDHFFENHYKAISLFSPILGLLRVGRNESNKP